MSGSPEKPLIRADLVFRELEGCFVVYDPVCDTTALLNVQAAAVLDYCDGANSAADIAAELAEVFAVPAASLVATVTAALADFAAKGWLQPLPA